MEFWIIWAVFFVLVVLLVRTTMLRRIRGREYQWRKDKGACYMEDGKLFLNAPWPSVVQAAPAEEVDHVLFEYDIWSMERGTRYHISLRLVKKDGTMTKEVYYPHSATQHYNPNEMVAELEALGVKYVRPTGKGSALRGNHS